MSDELIVDVLCQLGWRYTADRGLATLREASELAKLLHLGPGDGAGQVDQLWYDAERPVDDLSFEDLDLTALPRTLYNTDFDLAFANVRALVIVNLATDPSHVLAIGAAASNAWSPWISSGSASVMLEADSALVLTNRKNDWPVDSSNKVLRIANGSEDPVSYRIAIAGVAPGA